MKSYYIIALINFTLLTLISAYKSDDCASPVECFIKAKALLEQDRKEMRNTIDKLTMLVEEYKRNITESTKNELNSVTAPIGTIVFHASSKEQIDPTKDLPQGWTLCDGRALLRNEFIELFASIGVSYGAGDGTNSFNLPDLRGRVIIASGQGSGLSFYKPGMNGGEESHVLNVNEMPAHQHEQGGESLHNTFGGGSQIRGGRTYPSGEQSDFVNQLTSSVGENRPHNNLQPFISHHAIIRIK
jgi:microcystin-dependent protein